MKQLERLAGCPTEAIDRLIGISDSEQVAIRASKAGQDLYLGEVGVLEFVGENEPCVGASLAQNSVITVQESMRPRDHVAEGARDSLPQASAPGWRTRGKSRGIVPRTSRITQRIFRFSYAGDAESLSVPAVERSPRTVRGVTSSSWQRLTNSSRSLRNWPMLAARMKCSRRSSRMRRRR